MTVAGEPVCAAKALTVGYRTHTVVEGTDLEIARGAMVVITGPSGSGKSSLLYCLAGLLRPRAGTVTIDGHDLWSLRDASRSLLRARTMGFLFQDYVLDGSRTVLDNVLEPLAYAGRRPRAADRDRARALVDRVGVEVPLHRRPGQISGGQAQRIALARALIAEPVLLLADEPTGSLDERSGAIVIDVIRAELDDPTSALAAAVIVSHDLALAARADRHLQLVTSATTATLRIAR